MSLKENEEDPGQLKFDFDSEQGYESVCAVLPLLEQLFLALKLIPKARDYRDKFSKAYKNHFAD